MCLRSPAATAFGTSRSDAGLYRTCHHHAVAQPLGQGRDLELRSAGRSRTPTRSASCGRRPGIHPWHWRARVLGPRCGSSGSPPELSVKPGREHIPPAITPEHARVAFRYMIFPTGAGLASVQAPYRNGGSHGPEWTPPCRGLDQTALTLPPCRARRPACHAVGLACGLFLRAARKGLLLLSSLSMPLISPRGPDRSVWRNLGAPIIFKR